MTRDYKIGEWYPWTGGEQPVPNGTRVQWILNDGDRMPGDGVGRVAQMLDWDDEIIIAFSVVSYPKKKWEPRGGAYYHTAGGKVFDNGAAGKSHYQAGAESQTFEQAERKARDTVARNRLQTFVDEEGELGKCAVRWNRVHNEWVAVDYPLLISVGEPRMSYDTAKKAAEMLNNGTLKLEID